MKTWKDLDETQRNRAINIFERQVLVDIVSGALHFNDEQNGDDFQAVVDAALQAANDMQTPWFAGEYVSEARFTPEEGHIVGKDGKWAVAAQILSLAQPVAEDANLSKL